MKDTMLENHFTYWLLEEQVLSAQTLYHIFRKTPGYHIINLDKLTYAANLDNLTEVTANPAIDW